MKRFLLLFTIIFSSWHAYAQGQGVPARVITNIQSQFNGRVIGTQPNYDGGASVQVLTQDNRVIIVTVDGNGNIVGVRD